MSDTAHRNGRVTVKLWLNGMHHEHSMYFVDTEPKVAADLAVEFVVYTVFGRRTSYADVAIAKQEADVTFAYTD